MNADDIRHAAVPGLGRRLAAIFYDSWLIVALWLLGATVDYFVQSALRPGQPVLQLPLQIYIVLCPFVFFGGFWTHGGQTLGMRAWRLKLYSVDGQTVSWRQSVVRVASAYLSALAAGLGYLWVLFNNEGLSWHDHFSNTRLVMTSKD